MADAAAVGFLLQNLQQLVIHHYKLISGVAGQVKQLQDDLDTFKAFLIDSVKIRRKDESLRVLVRQIRDVVYEAEDIIDTYVTEAAAAERSRFKSAPKTPAKLLEIAKTIEPIREKVKAIKGDKSGVEFANQLSIEDAGPEEQEAPQIREENVVGFEDEAEKLIGYLTENTNCLDVISIIGMPGLGKTTLARKIFKDPAIQYEFPIRIWVYVSSEFKRKNVFLDILKQLRTNLTEDVYRKNDDDLAKEVGGELERGKFLIVMDDVWTAEDWKKLEIAFPKTNNGGKVLITSRQETVGLAANLVRNPHKLRFLTFEESCLLLSLEALGKREFPDELEDYGKQIVEQCDGLPLAIVVVGGILVKKRNEKNAWEKVSKRVTAYLKEEGEKSQGRVEKIISLSYDKLPFHLRPCFLYFGMFPEDYKIPVWKLIRMWIAEGFIEDKEGISQEDTAEDYLQELINRNLARVEKMSSDGRVKTCIVHDMLRDFCKTEAGVKRENFLQEIRMHDNGVFQPEVSEVPKFRRLSIHSDISDFFSSKPNGPSLRSFACLSKGKASSEKEISISTIAAIFKLLRVLDVEPIRFSKLSKELFQLVHLRYLTLSFTLATLPSAFEYLWNIQTLVVDTTCGTLDIKADIWEMIHLRHLKTNASTTLPKPGKNSKGGKQLQTLGTISPKSCTEQVFDKACNLRKLGIRGRLASLRDGKSSGSFDNLEKLTNLEKLKLINDTSSDGKLGGLPAHDKFPVTLRSLTLSGTFLDWSHMRTIGTLENLQVLKLKEKAFMGKNWKTADRSFQSLEVLHIERTDLQFWGATGQGHFPRLKSLALHNCEELREIPNQLADIQSLQLLDLQCTIRATASARKIEKAKKENTDQASGSFKLIIFPPEK